MTSLKELEFDSHGFSVVDVSPGRLQFDTFFISDREDPQATVSFYRGYVSEKGSRTVTRAAAQVPALRGQRASSGSSE